MRFSRICTSFKSHYRKIGRMALVTDSKLLEELPRIAGHLVHGEVKHFSESEYEAALSWLKAGALVRPRSPAGVV